eukprot:GHVP01055940.1.p1 GENE.GHVP01055940.1~~GHVP01055940.1.p1  ORF type:complete len:106 (-),score=25.91 GHVP01055940.1:97-414(-)
MDQKLICCGKIQNTVDKTLIIEAKAFTNFLNIGTELFLEDGKTLGKIEDIFGQVDSPFYAIELADNEDLTGTNVFYSSEVMSFVDIEELKLDKGTDADDEENIEE